MILKTIRTALSALFHFSIWSSAAILGVLVAGNCCRVLTMIGAQVWRLASH
jgi:hypothetical protein